MGAGVKNGGLAGALAVGGCMPYERRRSLPEPLCSTRTTANELMSDLRQWVRTLTALARISNTTWEGRAPWLQPFRARSWKGISSKGARGRTVWPISAQPVDAEGAGRGPRL